MVGHDLIDWSGSGPVEDCVTLTVGGTRCTVARAALHAMIDLELRGVRLRVENQSVVASPKNVITSDEIALLKRHRDDIRRLAAYGAQS
jgi:hypothetical protein